MKKTKKLLALVLAMVMAFAMLAIPAAAQEVEEHDHAAVCATEGAIARIPAMDCYKCHAPMVYTVNDETPPTMYKMVCPNGCKTDTDWIPIR